MPNRVKGDGDGGSERSPAHEIAYDCPIDLSLEDALLEVLVERGYRFEEAGVNKGFVRIARFGKVENAATHPRNP